MNRAPFPANEFDRVKSLLSLDLDYGDLEDDFKHIVSLAAKVTGMDLTVINLIDTFNQWSIAKYGLEVGNVPREESVCQFTILEDEHYEVKDLALDPKHKDRSYVLEDPRLRYYFGVPLKASQGVNIGSLCVLDREVKALGPDQIEYLKILADEIVLKLKSRKLFSELRNHFVETIENHKKIGVELQEALAGIIGISDVLMDPEIPHTPEDGESFIKLINERGKSMAELTKPLITEPQDDSDITNINLAQLTARLESLYSPLAIHKDQTLEITFNQLKNHIQFSLAGVLGALNYPVSGSLFLSTPGSAISVSLDITVLVDGYTLLATVKSNSTPPSESALLSPPGYLQSNFKYSIDSDAWYSELSMPLHVI